jgi:hypothetical protein
MSQMGAKMVNCRRIVLLLSCIATAPSCAHVRADLDTKIKTRCSIMASGGLQTETKCGIVVESTWVTLQSN